MRRARTSAAAAATAPPITPSLFGFLLLLASLSCWMDGNNVLVDAAHPQRLVKDFMEDGTPVWNYVDLPPLDVALDSMDGKLSGDDGVDEEGRKLGAENNDDDHDQQAQQRRDLRQLQSANGCPAQSNDYSFAFDQDVYIILYDVDRTMNAGEQRAFERRVLNTWNNPSNNCFTSCFYIDSVKVIQQTLLGDHDPDFDFITYNDDQGDRRDLAEEDEDEAGAEEDFARTLEAALSDDSFSDDDQRRLDPGHRHRRRRNRVKTRTNGRCRSRCRTPIKARDRRLHELEENQRMVDVSNDGQIADYYRALDEHDYYYQPTHRRLFGCEELLQEELEDMARSYRGIGSSAFNCLTSLRVATAPDRDECIHTPHSSSSRSSLSSGKGGGKGGDYRERESRSYSTGKGKGGYSYNTYRTQNNNYYANSKGSKGGGNYYGNNYRTSYYGGGYYSSKGSKGSF